MNDIPIEIDSVGVLHLLNNINTNKSCGPDNVTGIMLKTFDSVVFSSLAAIFGYSLETATLPRVWKLGKVQPIHKKGSKQLPNNYRPISLTSIVCKLLEHIISSHMHKIFKENHFFADNQHGFRPHRSCETQLAHTLGHISHLYDHKHTIDVIILDFSKAFDTVNHRKLIFKLERTGLNSRLILWISSFLRNRQQYVEIEHHKSVVKPVVSGVPQGSVLGPLLFLIFINDLPTAIQSQCRLFADDAIIYNTSNNISNLQTDLVAVENWARQWQMSFNVDKCVFLQIGAQIVGHPGYSFCGKLLPKVDSSPYLGLQLQCNLKWDEHINRITSKATQKLAMIRRVLKTADLPTRKIAYFSLVRPSLEFGSQIWDPYYKHHIKQLEKIQNKALRFIFNIKGQISFTKLREDTNIESLKERRKQGRFKLFVRCLAEGIEPSFEYNLKKYNTRQKDNTYTPHIRSNIFYHSFWPRTLRELRSEDTN